MRSAVYAVYPRNASKIPADAEALHLVRPVAGGVLEKILKKSPVKEIYLSNSCRQRLGAKSIQLLKGHGITLKQADNRGRAIEISSDKLKEIIELHRDYQSYREIERLTGIPKSTAHYLIAYANRSKVKRGNQVVYLK